MEKQALKDYYNEGDVEVATDAMLKGYEMALSVQAKSLLSALKYVTCAKTLEEAKRWAREGIKHAG